jgi:hypothetical protein
MDLIIIDSLAALMYHGTEVEIDMITTKKWRFHGSGEFL